MNREAWVQPYKGRQGVTIECLSTQHTHGYLLGEIGSHDDGFWRIPTVCKLKIQRASGNHSESKCLRTWENDGMFQSENGRDQCPNSAGRQRENSTFFHLSVLFKTSGLDDAHLCWGALSALLSTLDLNANVI